MQRIPIANVLTGNERFAALALIRLVTSVHARTSLATIKVIILLRTLPLHQRQLGLAEVRSALQLRLQVFLIKYRTLSQRPLQTFYWLLMKHSVRTL